MEREELLRSKEYWMANIQNDLYGMVEEHRKRKGLKQKDLAVMLGVSKGYISQILHGDFNHKLSKLVEIALAFNKAPEVIYHDLDELIRKDAAEEDSLFRYSGQATNVTLATVTSESRNQNLQPVYAEDTDTKGGLVVHLGQFANNHLQSHAG